MTYILRSFFALLGLRTAFTLDRIPIPHGDWCSVNTTTRVPIVAISNKPCALLSLESVQRALVV